MSDQLGLWDDGSDDAENSVGRRGQRASLYREMRYLLTISSGTSRVGRLSPSGLAHCLGVCLIEDFNMARGQNKVASKASSTALPRFVDIKLSQEQRELFSTWYQKEMDGVRTLQGFSDAGYRVGVTWSGEHQSYTVSLTCRDPESPNNGLCMTSYSGDLRKAIQLAWFKHHSVAHEDWSTVVEPPGEEFG